MQKQKNTINKSVNKWQESCWDVAEDFCLTYYGDNLLRDCYWVGDDVGSIFVVNEEFWGLDEIVESLRRKIPKNVLFDFYDYRTDRLQDNPKMPKYNLKTFTKLKQEKK